MKLERNCVTKYKQILRELTFVVIIFWLFEFAIDLILLMLFNKISEVFIHKIIYMINIFLIGIVAFKRVNKFFFNKGNIFRRVIFGVAGFSWMFYVIYFLINKYPEASLQDKFFVYVFGFIFGCLPSFISISIAFGVNPWENVNKS